MEGRGRGGREEDRDVGPGVELNGCDVIGMPVQRICGS